MVTVALRRVNLDAPPGQRLLDVISPERLHDPAQHGGLLHRRGRDHDRALGRELLGTDLVKLEVIGDERTLFPDVAATLEAARVLVADGFTVLPYVTDDPVACQRLEELGCAGGDAARRADRLRARHPQPGQPAHHPRDASQVPVIVDAGVGTASDAAVAMELGATARADEHRASPARRIP